MDYRCLWIENYFGQSNPLFSLLHKYQQLLLEVKPSEYLCPPLRTIYCRHSWLLMNPDLCSDNRITMLSAVQSTYPRQFGSHNHKMYPRSLMPDQFYRPCHVFPSTNDKLTHLEQNQGILWHLLVSSWRWINRTGEYNRRIWRYCQGKMKV